MRTALPQPSQKVRAVTAMFDAIAPRYDLVNRVMTFGLDARWRRRTVAELGLPGGSVVGDLACGTGDLCRVLNSAGYMAVGFDMSGGMLKRARTSAPLARADVLRLPLRTGQLDGATCGFALRNFASIPDFLVELARVLRPGGRLALLEVSQPSNSLLRVGHAVYFRRLVPMIGAALSDGRAYRYLPESVAYLPSVQGMQSLLSDSGFEDIRREPLTGGIAQLITATRQR